MANYFQITRPDGMGTLKLDSQGRADVQYTVKNVGAVRIEGRATLASYPPKAGPVEKGWVKIDGVAQRVFEPGESQTFTVKVAVPPKQAAGQYTFELDVINVARPDEGDTGQRVGFAIQQDGKPTPKPFPWWIPVAAIVLLAVIGGTVWWVLRPKGIAVPDLAGKTLSEATDELNKAGLSLSPNVATQNNTAANAGKVIAQSPAAKASVAKQSSVAVTVGAVLITVPDVVAADLQSAQAKIQAAGLVSGTITTRTVTTVGGGFVLSESPAAGTSVASSTPVDLIVAAKTVAVPNVVGQPIGQALTTLQSFQLQMGTLTGNGTTQNVIAQSPGVGTPVPVGQKVNLTVPSTCAPFLCIYNPLLAQRMATERVLINPSPGK